MANTVAHSAEKQDAAAIVRCLHELVTCGPRHPDIASAMFVHGYDEVKWAEGQGVLAELVSSGWGSNTSLAVAVGWYEEAAIVARQALATRPRLLAKLGVSTVSSK
jgi:hypothetical protein